MTRTTILRNYSLSYDNLINTLYDIDTEGYLTDDQYSDIASEIISKVDDSLPGSLMWMPHTSEIWADTDDDASIDSEQFNDILNEAFEEVLRPLLF